MATSTPAKLRNLRAQLDAKPDQEVLRMYLQKNGTSGLLKDAILVTVHRIWSAHPPQKLTEIGITTYETQQANRSSVTPLGPHAEELLKNVWCLHLRIRSHAHLPSFPGSPDGFHFGTSVFVSQEEALDMLHQIWNQPMDMSRPELGSKPIVYLSYGNNDGIAKSRRALFDFDPSTMSTTVATLDAQNIAMQTKITSKPDAALDYVLQVFKIIPYDVGNSGNAAMYSTIIAFLSTLRMELYRSAKNPRGAIGLKGPSSSKSAQSVMQQLMERPTPPPPFGVTVYCWRCGSGTHAFPECPNADLQYSKCSGSSILWRKENAETHMEGLCVFR